MKCLEKHNNLKVTRVVPFERSLIDGSVISLGVTRERQCSDAAQIRLACHVYFEPSAGGKMTRIRCTFVMEVVF
jgi:hypothetical protein